MLRTALASIAAALVGTAAAAQPTPSPAPATTLAPTPDYAREAAWLCRPGRQDACAGDLSTLVLDARGTRRVERFEAAAAPPIDCFYVYPTVSQDRTLYSDLDPGPEEARSALSQAGRFRTRCRVFSPLYRQFTLAGLRYALAGGRSRLDFTAPYTDVRAAWRDYLARDNARRGVVLIGHSQGAILLSRLLAEEIDVHPDQRRRLVSAILAGHPGLSAPIGSIPLCRNASQTGCIVVFASYAADDAHPQRFYGQAPRSGQAGCVSPSALTGGPSIAYFGKAPDAPSSDPPYFAAVGHVTAECVADSQGSALRYSIKPGPHEAELRQRFARAAAVPGWGLHSLDLSLSQGALLELVESQSRAWRARRSG
jgi:hypothetical protein